MHIETTRLGKREIVEVEPEQVLQFPEGLVGFENLRPFVRLWEDSYRPFEWLQSLDDADICFVLTEPGHFFPSYNFELAEDDVSALDLRDAGEADVLVILVVPDDPQQISANLVAPIVINRRTRIGRQVILQDSEYQIRTPVLGGSSVRPAVQPSSRRLQAAGRGRGRGR